MVVALNKQVLQDLRLLPTLQTAFFDEFCKIAVNNLKAGTVNPKMYNKAAESLGVEVSVVSAAIVGLAQVLLECAKKNLSVSDFAVTVGDLKFSEDQLKSLSLIYQDNIKKIRSDLGTYDMKVEHYLNVDWRLDIQLGSRCLRNHVKPTFVLQLETTTADNKSKIAGLECDYANMKHMVDELEKALAEAGNSHCRRIVTYVK